MDLLKCPYYPSRRQFKTRVNCWFCNKNTWVPYVNKNQWTCPGCDQYNGFKEDGDYNKDLQAQYSPKYNKQPVPRTQQQSVHGTKHVRQLCETCNRNQELKVHQLASFTPTDERNYDEEVEVYKEQLEEAYRLCPSCERLVKWRLNQFKTLALKRKNPFEMKEKKRGKPLSLLSKLKRIISQILLIVVIIILIQYFININLNLITLIKDAFVGKFDINSLLSLLSDNKSLLDNDSSMGYRMALGITILVLLGKGEPMSVREYISVLTLCSLHFLIGEGLLKQWTMYPMISDYILPIEWSLRVVALLSSVAIFIETLRRSPEASIKLNNSFHRIEVEDHEEENIFEDSRSMSYTGTNRLDNSTDFGSVFEYPQSMMSSRGRTAEDEEIRSISMNRSFHNKSDPIVQWTRQSINEMYNNQNNIKQNNQDHDLISNRSSHTNNKMSVQNLHSPSKLLFPDDRFSNSIKTMRIGSDQYHQMQSPGPMSSPAPMNPFMKNMPLSASNSQLSNNKNKATSICGSNRSLLTPSRLSLACSSNYDNGSAFTDAKSSSWMTKTANGGFWNNQYPNVFTARSPSVNVTTQQGPSSFAYARPKPVAALSLDHGLNSNNNEQRFVPLLTTESRSSSQSSGFESSVQIPAFSPIGGGEGGLSPTESVFNDHGSVFSGSRWTEEKSGQVKRTQTWSTTEGERDTMGMGAFFQPNVFPR